MKYAELDAAAKEWARGKRRESLLSDDWWECVYEDAVICLGFLGFDATESVARGRASRTGDTVWVNRPTIQFSGFSSQGDGACFTGDWAAKRVDMAKLVEHAPEDKTLHNICAELSAIALQYPDMTAAVTRASSSYCHAYTMSLDSVECDTTEDHEWTLAMAAADAVLLACARNAAHWIYKQLEEEYDCLTSDEAIVEGIEANEYDFDEAGNVE